MAPTAEPTNYEKYFYDNQALAKASEQDKLVVEMMVRF